MGALENFWKPLQVGDHENAKNIRLRRKTFLWHQNWCHSTKTRFRLSFLVPKRSQAPALSRVWRQNGANLSQNLLPHHYRNLRASKTTFIFETSWKYFVATYLPVRGACVCLTSPFPYSNMEGQKTTSYFSLFLKSFSIPIPHGFEVKSKHRAEAFSFYFCTATSKAEK